MKNLRNILIVIFIVSAIQMGAQEKVNLQLKWTHAFQFAGYYAAVEQGYYFDEGLEVNIVEANPDTDVVQDVLNGKAQYGVGCSGLLLERAAGKPVVVLAVVFQHSPYRIFASSEIHNLNELKGKRLMLEPHSEELIAYLKKSGIQLENVSQIPHSFDANSLIKGETAAMSGYVSSEPYYYSLANFPYRVFNPRSVGIDFYGDNLFTSDKEIEENPERVKVFRSASMKGWEYAKEHPDEIIDLILTKYSKQHTRDYLQFESDQMIPLLQPDLIEIGYMNPNRWQHIANTYAEIGLLPTDYPLNDFIFQVKEPDMTLFYRSLILTILLLIIISLIALYILKVNRKLTQSIEEIQQANKALAVSEQSYFGLFNSITEAIYIQDEKGYFIDVNDGVEKMYGYTREELIGKTPAFLSTAEKNNLPQIMKSVKFAFETGVAQKFEFWGKRKNGEIFPKEVICTKGKYIGEDVIVATSRDITDRKQAEEIIITGRERLKMLNKIIRHDLSNDFAVIKSGISLYRSKSDKSILTEIEKRVKKSIKTIEEYRKYEDFIDSNADLKEFELADSLRKFKEEFPEIELSIDGHCKVFADDALDSVFFNLISNSIKHGNSSKIDITIIAENEMCRIEVMDNGTVIPDEVKEKIFDEGSYFGDAGNTGIGLHIVKKTIENYGGSVFVMDNEFSGTTVIILLRRFIA
jgi:PAS domain S-box-containing protein